MPMPFVLFRNHFRDLAERETRTVTVLEHSGSDLPAGEYGFIEMFCDEPGCDCRRVFLSVFSMVHEKFVAVIHYGWESPEFYAAWMKEDDPELREKLRPNYNFMGTLPWPPHDKPEIDEPYTREEILEYFELLLWKP